MPLSLQEYLKLIPVTTSVIQSSPVLLELWQASCHDQRQGKSLGTCPSDQPPSSEESLSSVQSELALIQLHSIPSLPATGHQRGEISTSPPLLPLRKVQKERKTCLTSVSGNPWLSLDLPSLEGLVWLVCGSDSLQKEAFVSSRLEEAQMFSLG